jgi:hypothetical protein
MLLYLAGGFHFSNSVESEKKLAEHLLKKYDSYKRLGTFFYEKDAVNIIQVVEELNNGNKKVTENS